MNSVCFSFHCVTIAFAFPPWINMAVLIFSLNLMPISLAFFVCLFWKTSIQGVHCYWSQAMWTQRGIFWKREHPSMWKCLCDNELFITGKVQTQLGPRFLRYCGEHLGIGVSQGASKPMGPSSSLGGQQLRHPCSATENQCAGRSNRCMVTKNAHGDLSIEKRGGMSQVKEVWVWF